MPNSSSPGASLPLIPMVLAKRLAVHERYDTRFRACARLQQALWLGRQQIPTGHHRDRTGRARRLGSRLSPAAALAGRNFLTPDLAELAHRVITYQEPGAFIARDRVLANAIGSTSLCLNAMGFLAMDLDLAAKVLRQLLPDQDIDTVTAIRFEHSPARRSMNFTNDGTAFDCCVWFVRKRRTRYTERTGVLCMEWKYTEGLSDSAPISPGHYDALAESSGLFPEPNHAALRVNPLQQLFREHLLAQAAVMNGHWPSAVFASIAPAANDRVQRQADLYQTFLNPALEGQVPFVHLTLEAFVDAMASSGKTDGARILAERYLDLGPVHELVAAALKQQVSNWAPRPRPAQPIKLIVAAA
jgi:hypothetical protein